MDWKKGIGYGVVLWILMSVIVSALASFQVYGARTGKIIVIIAAGILSYLLARLVGPGGSSSALLYGVVWVIVGLVLDALISIRFYPSLFATRSLWASYLLVLLAPLLAVKKS